MAAYIITQVHVHDPETFEKYREQAGPVLAGFGGRFLVRGGAMEVLEGDWPYPRGVIIEFPDTDAAKTWHDSPEYGEIKTLRHASAKANMIVVEGAEGAPGATAEISKAGYVIAQVDVTDPDAFEAYRAQVPATLERYGGGFIVRGGAMEVLEGAWAHPRCVVLRFAGVDAAKTWWASPEYEGPKAERQACADTNLVVVEGVE